MVPIRVAILDQVRLYRDGLRRLLDGEPTVAIVGDGGGDGIQEFLRATSPDILLAGVGDEGALSLCSELRRTRARPWVILLASDHGDDWAARALEAGARGILPKSAGPDDLFKAIRVVHEGQLWARKQVIARVVEKLAALADDPSDPARVLRRLSRREQDVARQVALGLCNKEVADRLDVSEATVKAHLTRVFQKLRVHTRAQLIALYHAREGHTIRRDVLPTS